MFRPMRRKERAISDEEAKKLLLLGRRGVLAINGDDGYPYAIPVNYFYDMEQGKIYFHGSRAGHKVDSLKKDDRVCFTVYGNEHFKEGEWAPYMQSTVVFGRCHLVEKGAEATEILKKLAAKYYPDEQLIDEEIERSGKAVQLFEIEIEHISGKEIQEK